MSHGAAANDSGKVLEHLVRSTLAFYGVSHRKPTSTGVWGLSNCEILPDVIIPELSGFDDGLWIECRRQRGPGTAKDKMYKTLLNIKQNYPRPTIVVLDGQEFSVIHKEFNDSLNDRLVGCMWFDDFVEFIEGTADGGNARKLLRPGFDSKQTTFLTVVP